MKPFGFLKSSSLGAVLAHMAIAAGIFVLAGIIYFNVYLPSTTNHGESITVPDLTGMKLEELEAFLSPYELRYDVGDSSYSDEYPPLAVMRQYPSAGSIVKENRVIYISINQVFPPTVPIPDLIEGSRINAEAVLTSNKFRLGKIYREPSPFMNLVIEMQHNGRKLEPGERLPTGSVIDLVVGDGNGSDNSQLKN